MSSLVAGGCIVSGASVHRSLLSTGGRVNSFSAIDEAVVLPYVEVGRDARLRRVVVDRGVDIPEGLVVGEDPGARRPALPPDGERRRPDHPGNDQQARSSMTRVLAVASEIFPLVKTGGLADVVGCACPGRWRVAVDMRTLVPGYPAVLAGLEADGGPLRTPPRPRVGRCGSSSGRAAGLDLLSPRRAPPLRPPGQSLSRPRRPRLAGQSTAATGCSRGSRPISASAASPTGGPRPSTATTGRPASPPAYLAFAGEPRPATVLTIHNLAFQGTFPATIFPELRLPPWAFSIGGVEVTARSASSAGILLLDAATASPT